MTQGRRIWDEMPQTAGEVRAGWGTLPDCPTTPQPLSANKSPAAAAAPNMGWSSVVLVKKLGGSSCLAAVPRLPFASMAAGQLGGLSLRCCCCDVTSDGRLGVESCFTCSRLGQNPRQEPLGSLHGTCSEVLPLPCSLFVSTSGCLQHISCSHHAKEPRRWTCLL